MDRVQKLTEIEFSERIFLRTYIFYNNLLSFHISLISSVIERDWGKKGHEISFRLHPHHSYKDSSVTTSSSCTNDEGAVRKKCSRFEKARSREGVSGSRGRRRLKGVAIHAGDKCVHATKRRHVDHTHVRSNENLHATSCGLSPSLLIKSSVTILSRYPRGVEAAPIMVAMMMMMMVVVTAKGERVDKQCTGLIYTFRIEYADFSIFNSPREFRTSSVNSFYLLGVSWNLAMP